MSLDTPVELAAGIEAKARARAKEQHGKPEAGAVPSFDGAGHPMVPCPRTLEVGNSKGDDYGGSIRVTFPSLARSLGRHVTNATTTGSTCPPSNTRGCYQLTYTVSRVG